MTTRDESRRTIQFARADFVVRAIRERLPQSSLCHEKLGSLQQLEILTIISRGGIYSVYVLDATHPNYRDNEGLFRFGDLGVRFLHAHQSHQSLSDAEIWHLLKHANHEFDALLASDPISVASQIRRVTCLMTFETTRLSINLRGQELFERLQTILDWPLQYEPYVVRELWLPGPDSPAELEECREGIQRAGEFVFDRSLPVEAVVAKLQTTVRPKRSHLRRIAGPVPEIPEIGTIEVIGRHF